MKPIRLKTRAFYFLPFKKYFKCSCTSFLQQILQDNKVISFYSEVRSISFVSQNSIHQRQPIKNHSILQVLFCFGLVFSLHSRERPLLLVTGVNFVSNWSDLPREHYCKGFQKASSWLAVFPFSVLKLLSCCISYFFKIRCNLYLC